MTKPLRFSTPRKLTSSTPIFPQPKAQFDAWGGVGFTKHAMPSDKAKFDAIKAYERAEQIGLGHRDCITYNDLAGLYESMAGAYEEVGLMHEAQLVRERARRNLG